MKLASLLLVSLLVACAHQQPEPQIKISDRSPLGPAIPLMDGTRRLAVFYPSDKQINIMPGVSNAEVIWSMLNQVVTVSQAYERCSKKTQPQPKAAKAAGKPTEPTKVKRVIE